MKSTPTAADSSSGLPPHAFMSTIDKRRYGRLLARRLPSVIQTDEENQRLIKELTELDSRCDSLSPEESSYAGLLTVLIESFEDARYGPEGSTPQTRLRSLMAERGLRQRDLFGVFGSSGIASEVVRGLRGISRAQALRLGKYSTSRRTCFWHEARPRGRRVSAASNPY